MIKLIPLLFRSQILTEPPMNQCYASYGHLTTTGEVEGRLYLGVSERGRRNLTKVSEARWLPHAGHESGCALG